VTDQTFPCNWCQYFSVRHELYYRRHLSVISCLNDQSVCKNVFYTKTGRSVYMCVSVSVLYKEWNEWEISKKCCIIFYNIIKCFQFLNFLSFMYLCTQELATQSFDSIKQFVQVSTVNLEHKIKNLTFTCFLHTKCLKLNCEKMVSLYLSKHFLEGRTHFGCLRTTGCLR